MDRVAAATLGPTASPVAQPASRSPQAVIGWLHREVAARDREIERLHAAVADRDATLTWLHREVAARDGRIAALAAAAKPGRS